MRSCRKHSDSVGSPDQKIGPSWLVQTYGIGGAQMKYRILARERDVGPRGGDQQPAHERGRGGKKTRPSRRDAGWQSGKSGKSGKGGKK